MNVIRIAVLVLGVAAAGGAVLLALSPKPQPPAPVPTTSVAPPPTAQVLDQILVAAHDLPIGKVLKSEDVTWQSWPKDSIASFMIQKDDKVIADIDGSIARGEFYEGEPIRRERLIKSAGGFLSAILPSGMRAVAISIDAQGSTSAGGFVLPNDRVDVIRTVKAPGNASDAYLSETILNNVKVLAIGQNAADKNGGPNQVGSTATLELDPVQAETIVLAQRTGQLSLALRSVQDAAHVSVAGQAGEKTSVIRYGVETDAAPR
jgi:pilus assembly protein CpaB